MNSSADHIHHVFINKENEGKHGDDFDHSPYLFKDMVHFLEYGHERIQKAFEGKLPVLHQQCSHSPVEKIEGNTLRCCLGPQVDTCLILLRLKATFEEHWKRDPVAPGGHDSGAYYRDKVSADDMYRIMTRVCAHHIYEESKKHFVDASEGFHLDSSDRMFWSRVYESMSGPEPEVEEA